MPKIKISSLSPSRTRTEVSSNYATQKLKPAPIESRMRDEARRCIPGTSIQASRKKSCSLRHRSSAAYRPLLGTAWVPFPRHRFDASAFGQPRCDWPPRRNSAPSTSSGWESSSAGNTVDRHPALVLTTPRSVRKVIKKVPHFVASVVFVVTAGLDRRWPDLPDERHLGGNEQFPNRSPGTDGGRRRTRTTTLSEYVSLPPPFFWSPVGLGALVAN